MRYLIIDKGQECEVFYTEWFTVDNYFAEGMIVIDLWEHKYMRKKGIWIEIQYDHL